MPSAASGFPTSTMPSVAATRPGASTRYAGSKSMPTETKNSTAKASRIGSASAAARRLNSERPTTMPARNAPSAIDTPNSMADPTAMPRASTSTVSVNSSRERVPATRSSSQGMAWPPTRNVKATRAAILSAATPSACAMPAAPAPPAAEQGREQDEHDDGEQVLDDQPADGDVPGRRVQVAVVGQHPHQHDGARHRDRQAEHQAGGPAPAERPRHTAPSAVATTLRPSAPGMATRRTATAPSGGSAARRRTSGG